MFSSLYWERLERQDMTCIPKEQRSNKRHLLRLDLLVQKCEQVSHDNDNRPLKSHNYLLELMSSFCARVKLWSKQNSSGWEWETYRGKPHLASVMRLTGCRYEIKETLLREQRVFQPPEIELQNTCHRVDVVISLVIHQWILPCADSIHLIHTLVSVFV